MKKQTQAAYNVGIYCRLSREDGNGESVSIQSQKLMLTEYVNERHWRIVDYYVDDGVSGGTFDRPELNRLIEDIEAGKINLVICKDLSRLGRNYIAAGHFCEMYFPSKGVRFLAINDNFDTDNESESDIAPFKHVLNDMYLRDLSRKIKSAFKAKAKAGQFIGSFAPLGYAKDPQNKNHLVIDEKNASLVRRIFDMFASGMGTMMIASALTKEKVPTPSAAANDADPNAYAVRFEGNDETKRWRWNAEMVRAILKSKVYIGCVTSQMQFNPSMKSKKTKNRHPDEWVVVEGMHEPIVDRQTWDIVQAGLETKRRELSEENRSYGFVNEFAGILRCADCGVGMAHRVKRYVGKHKTTLTRHYVCATYLKSIDRPCTYHHVMYDDLYELVLRAIQKYAALTRDDKTEMAKQLLESGNHQKTHEVLQIKKTVKAAEKRLGELERLIMKLYEEYVSERLNGDNYSMMLAKYQNEQTELQQKVSALNEVLTRSDETGKNIDEFLSLIVRYADITALTPEVVGQLISKIAVHKAVTVDGIRTQQLDIHWRFIGMTNWGL